jgi:T5SS/PEP-CTERM-associated repeat protein
MEIVRKASNGLAVRRKNLPTALGAGSLANPAAADLAVALVHKSRGRPQPSRNPISSVIAAIVIAPGILMSRPIVASADNVWIPDTGGNWSDAANWSTGVPVAGDFVDIEESDNIGRTVVYDYTGSPVTLNALNIDLTDGTTTTTATNTLSITANTLTVGGGSAELAGESGNGAIDQSGGTNNCTGAAYLALGNLAGSVGSYFLSGTGSLSSSGGEYLAGSGTADFEQSGGTNFSASTIYMAYRTGSTCTYTLSGGLFASDGPEYVGDVGSATVNNSAGNNTPNGLYLGEDAGSSGTYTLSGTGTLMDTSDEYIGVSGNGTFNQTGGISDFVNNNQLAIAGLAGSTGAYSLSGGSLSAPALYVGGSSAGPGGAGTLTVSGTGNLYVQTTLTVYNTTGTSFEVNGGTVNATTLNLSAATYTQTAGSSTFGKITGTGEANIMGGRTTLSVGGGSSQLNALIISGNGALDLTNNHLFINFGASADPFPTIVGYVATGYAGGAWNGPGIDSSSASANTHYALGCVDGASGIVSGLAPGQIEIAYALYGDINLDGVVNGNDFAILASHFGHIVTGGWEQGDLNYGGTVNGNDFALLAGNFGKTATGTAVTLPASQWAALDAFAAAHGLLSDVPEPTTATLAVATAACLFARRQRRTNPSS